jgi:hypothetical protein
VSPKVTEGEDTEQAFRLPPPFRLASASHLPLAGEDQYQSLAGQRRQNGVSREQMHLIGCRPRDRANAEFR